MAVLEKISKEKNHNSILKPSIFLNKKGSYRCPFMKQVIVISLYA